MYHGDRNKENEMINSNFDIKEEVKITTLPAPKSDKQFFSKLIAGENILSGKKRFARDVESTNERSPNLNSRSGDSNSSDVAKIHEKPKINDELQDLKIADLFRNRIRNRKGRQGRNYSRSKSRYEESENQPNFYTPLKEEFKEESENDSNPPEKPYNSKFAMENEDSLEMERHAEAPIKNQNDISEFVSPEDENYPENTPLKNSDLIPSSIDAHEYEQDRYEEDTPEKSDSPMMHESMQESSYLSQRDVSMVSKRSKSKYCGKKSAKVDVKRNRGHHKGTDALSKLFFE